MTDLSDLPIHPNDVLDYLYLYAPLSQERLIAGIRELHGFDVSAEEVEAVIHAIKTRGWAELLGDGRWQLTEAGRVATGKQR